MADVLAPWEREKRFNSWRRESRNGSDVKVPYNHVKGIRASIAERSHWQTRKAALAYPHSAGLGVLLGADEGYTPLFGIDLDAILEATTGTPTRGGAEMLALLGDTYYEVSPSKTGVKAWFTVAEGVTISDVRTALGIGLGVDGKSKVRRSIKLSAPAGQKAEGVEFCVGGYFTFTGDAMADKPIAALSLDTLRALAELGERHFRAPAGGRDATDDGFGTYEGREDETESAEMFDALCSAHRAGIGKEDAREWVAEQSRWHFEESKWDKRRSEGTQFDRDWTRAGFKVRSEATKLAIREFGDLTVMEGKKKANPTVDELLGVRLSAAIKGEILPASGELVETGAEYEDDGWISYMNARNGVALLGATACIASVDEASGKVAFLPERSFHLLYRNKRVPVGDHGKTEPVSQWWLRQKKRHQFANVVFRPGEKTPRDVLNLWRGWGVETKAGDCSLILDHMLDVICSDNRTYFDYLIKWCGHMVQNPLDKPGVAVVLQGDEGVGKDIFGYYLGRIVGKSYVNITKGESALSKFNAQMETCHLMHVEEGFFAGDRKAVNELKGMVTVEHVRIERKGLDAYLVDNYARFLITSNEERVVDASQGARRWFALKVPNTKKDDTAYFKALRAEMNGEGPGALLHYLLNLDLTGFNVRDVPQTEALAALKVASFKPEMQWLRDALDSGDFGEGCTIHGDWSQGPAWVYCHEMRAACRAYLRERNRLADISDKAIYTLLEKNLPGFKHTKETGKSNGRERIFRFARLGECRARFEGTHDGTTARH
ncbi:MAG: hypothetical protein GC155_09785 [Alphaproteobacteria bacterium]|nr:hypothetical protein [Alphaproteobacteria bacterium]